MLVARRIDDTMWTLRRQGKGHFIVSSAGHEAIGAAAGLAADMHQDFLLTRAAPGPCVGCLLARAALGQRSVLGLGFFPGVE